MVVLVSILKSIVIRYDIYKYYLKSGEMNDLYPLFFSSIYLKSSITQLYKILKMVCLFELITNNLR